VPEPLLLRPTEAAQLLGIGRSTLYELMAAGAIPTIHIGRSVRIPLAQLKHWVDMQISSEFPPSADTPCDLPSRLG
jgi:excisionase family DNA binding protein